MMEIILGGRKSGRTSLLILRAAEAEKRGEICYIVCSNQRQVENIAQKAKELNLKINYPITHQELLGNRTKGMNIHHFLIDDADHLLQSLTPIPIKFITLEKSNENAEI